MSFNITDHAGNAVEIDSEVVSGKHRPKHSPPDGLSTNAKLDEIKALLQVVSGSGMSFSRYITNPTGSPPVPQLIDASIIQIFNSGLPTTGKSRVLLGVNCVFTNFSTGAQAWANDDFIVLQWSDAAANVLFQEYITYAQIENASDIVGGRRQYKYFFPYPMKTQSPNSILYLTVVPALGATLLPPAFGQREYAAAFYEYYTEV